MNEKKKNYKKGKISLLGTPLSEAVRIIKVAMGKKWVRTRMGKNHPPPLQGKRLSIVTVLRKGKDAYWKDFKYLIFTISIL